jgi:outer membrane protein assembly factor BamB
MRFGFMLLCLAAYSPDASMGGGAKPGAAAAAKRILDAAGIQGGLIVHLGCGDGTLTAALRVSDSCLVHGLDRDAANVAKAREHVQALGLYGPVSVDRLASNQLPYVDNLVNLVVAETLGDVPMAEVLRVLAPQGVAMIDSEKTVKPRPEDVDEWTHYFHGASGNAVSTDRRVAPPARLQWDGPPRWSRSHETDMSLTAAIAAGGRIFHTLDEGPVGIHETPLTTRRLPDKCALVARDAYNGIVLWRRPLPGWGSAAWDNARWRFGKRDQMWSSPLTLPRRLVTMGDRLYMTMGFRAPVSELDGVTGRTIREFSATRNTEEIVIHDDILLARTARKEGSQAVVAIELASGQVLWTRPAGKMADLTLAASGTRVCFVNRKGLVALDLRTGREQWQVSLKGQPKRTAPAFTLILRDDVVLVARPGLVQALAAADGERLWTAKTNASFRGPPDVFVAGGLVWVGTLTTRGLDLKTGQVKREIRPGSLFTAGHHSRCYRARATEHYLLFNKRGIEFLDLRGDEHMRHDWVRGTCRYGIIPANGLIYAPPHSCFCYPGVKLTGFNALAPAPKTPVKPDPSPRLRKGPAFQATDLQSAVPSAPSEDWPTYRHDNARSGCSAAPVPERLQQAWRTMLRGEISPPVVADGRVYVAALETHSVHCLAADTGKAIWTFTAGGCVDSPPTVCGGRVLFGCSNGAVYCLRATNGRLMWRFRAAPRDRRIVSYGRVESAWPVHGSVLVEDGVTYFAAGRSSFLDGGLYLFGLDVATGAVRHQARLVGPKPDLSKPSNRAHDMDGSRNDILVGTGGKLYLTQNVFDLSLKPLPAPRIARWGARKTDLHLVATGGFLDDSMFDRIYWMHARRWPGLYVAVATSKAGQILVFDQTTTYGLHVFTSKFSRSPYFQPATGGYELFADENDNEPVLTKRNAARERGVMTRAAPPKWSVQIPVRARAMVLTPPAPGRKAGRIFLAGPPDLIDPQDPLAALEGRAGAVLWAVSTADGAKRAEYRLACPPVFDGLIAAGGRLYMSMIDGTVLCFAGKE